jgi:hypothetical protein
VKVFLSWSGSSSRALAEALYEWLPRVIQSVRPWLSSSDIQAGVRWSAEVARELEETSFGILCLTPENLEAPWIMFEAGALSKAVQSARVVPYLLGVDAAQLKGPLAQFQAVAALPEPTQRLLRALNAALGERSLGDDQLGEAFEVWWPRFEKRLTSITEDLLRPVVAPPKRTQDDLLVEILQLVRAQERRAQLASEEGADPTDLKPMHPQRLKPGQGQGRTATSADSAPEASVMPGDRVEHRRFGKGTVIRAWGTGRDRRVRVDFDDPEVGTKQLLVAYANLEKAIQ